MNYRPIGNIALCPVCNSEEVRLYLKQSEKIFCCDKCSHVYSDPSARIGAEHYDINYYQEAHRNWFANPNLSLFSWIVHQISPKYRSLLDAGCGKGAFLRFVLGSIDTPIRLVGVDYTYNDPFLGIEYQQGELEDLPRNQCFDVVVSLAVIEHVADPVAFANELYKRCEVGGLVIVMTLNNDSFLYGVARLMAKFKIFGPCNRLYSAHHTQHFTPKSLRQTLEKNSLEIIKIHFHNAPIAALDIPARNTVVRLIYKAGVIVLLWTGLIFRRTYLQTIVARRNS